MPALDAEAEPCDTDIEEGESEQVAAARIDPAVCYTDVLEVTEEPGEEGEQPTLAAILRAVNKCTASVNNLQERFGGLKEEVSLVRQDLQKIRERNTASESRIREIEDKLPNKAQ